MGLAVWLYVRPSVRPSVSPPANHLHFLRLILQFSTDCFETCCDGTRHQSDFWISGHDPEMGSKFKMQNRISPITILHVNLKHRRIILDSSLHDCKVSNFSIFGRVSQEIRSKFKTQNCYIAISIEAINLRLHRIIPGNILHGCSVSNFSISGHVTQKRGQRWNFIV